MRSPILICFWLAALQTVTVAAAGDANRWTYLDEFCDPYYVHRQFPKLTTPQWVGEPGVEAVIVLGIDDLRETQKYELFLRPILERLKEIDGRAPVSIMACQVDPLDPQLQIWLQEGLSIETHTADHPCPCLQGGGLAKAKSTYDRCVDQMAAIPGSHPVAFRFPCMDSQNTPSPRAYAEIFNQTTPQGNFLHISSSVCVLLTPDDPDLPPSLVQGDDGQPRFARYAPFPSFVNKVENYPYPFVIGRLCWEFPCAVPDDWQGFHLQAAANPRTVADMKACLDATVIKQGVYNLIFHPHGWIGNAQLVDFVDYVHRQYRGRVKFLTFAECQQRLTEHLLAGQPLRAANGQDNGVRLLDLNQDGFLDVVMGNDTLRRTRVWDPDAGQWLEGEFPVEIVQVAGEGLRREAGVRFGSWDGQGRASFIVRNEHVAGAWHFDGRAWVRDDTMLNGLEVAGQPIFTAQGGQDQGVRLRDLDGDGRCELIVGQPEQSAALHWDPAVHAWRPLPFRLPAGTAIVDAVGRDAGLRFVDLNDDGSADVLFSNEQRFSVDLFESIETGWSRHVRGGQRGAEGAIPMIARQGTSNGAWFAERHLWVQNEDTQRLPDGVDRFSFAELLGGASAQPLSPDDALKSMRVRPGLEIELVAHEPLVMDPVAFDWGPDGKLWVAEMADYPLGIDGRGKPGGRVRFLEDTDGDMKYDKSTVFLDGLNFPTGVMAWRDGVLVTAAPELFYAEDTSGDGQADERVVLYHGFGEGNQQHRVNGLRWGLDNWIYLANGDSGGQIRSVQTGETVTINGRDLRIQPDAGLLDPQTGQAQFGRDRDDWGNWFGCNNPNPQWHYVLADHYLRRNPHAIPPDLRVPVSVTPGAAPVFPTSRTVDRFNDPGGANRFSSACSTMIYRDELLGPDFVGNSFVCEPVHNLVHREVVSPQEVTFSSRRADDEQQSEFLSSTDNWFRPVMVRTGPDGALWIADMYRAVIEHPEWIPDDWEARLDLRAGHDRGRIYRVYPAGSRPHSPPRLSGLDTAALVAALDSSNGWQRDMVQQLLIWRNDPAAAAPLEEMAQRHQRPLARLHALCTLDGLKSLKPRSVVAALHDEHPGIRRHAVRLAENLVNQSPEPGAALLPLVDDPDPQVQLQLACSLGQWQSPQAGQALGQLALKHHDDPYLSAALTSSLSGANIGAVLQAVLAADPAPPPLAEQLLGQAAALGDASILAQVMELVTARTERGYGAWQLVAGRLILDALDRRNIALAELLTNEQLRSVEQLFDEARRTAADHREKQPRRLAAIRLLARSPSADLALLSALLVPQNSIEIQLAAAAAIAEHEHPASAETLLTAWTSYSPPLRAQVLDALLTTEARAAKLLEAIAEGYIAAAHLDAAHCQPLLSHRSASVRELAERVLGSTASASRQDVLDQYQAALAMPGDRDRGRIVFARKCAACHRLEGAGHAIGPDLAALPDKSLTALVTAILDPNRAVEDKFLNYIAVDTDGRQFTGMLLSETSTNITLVGPDNQRHVLLRSEIDVLESSGKSSMPEGLERDLSPQDMADVMAYLSRLGPPPKPFPGNQPALVEPGADGVLRLSADNCRIYGSSLVFEPKYRNLGYWTSQDDRAAWSLTMPAGGAYRVLLDYACDNSTAGNTCRLEVGGTGFTVSVAGTGTWDDYQQTEIGSLELSAGTHELTLRATGNLRGALLDLRAIQLIPRSHVEAN